MKIPSFVWVLVTIVLGAGFLVVLSNNKQKQQIEGKTLPVLVEVYSDYNCPHCADYDPVVRDVENTYGVKVNVQKKHLAFLADSSTTYAQAAEAARKQGKFDDYHEQLFKWNTYVGSPEKTIYEYSEEEKALYQGQPDVTKIAEFLGLDLDQFAADLNSDEIVEIVRSQKEGFVKKFGTVSTPTVVIYGEKMDLATEDLKTKVGELITTLEAQASSES